MHPFKKSASLLATFALAFAFDAWTYSHIPVPTETLAEIADCAIQGVVESALSRREGPAIVTDISIKIENAAGDCPASTVSFTQFGGRLASGEAVGIAGVEPMAAGRRYIVLLEKRSTLAPLYGPQGVFLVETVASGKSVVNDLTGQRIGIARDGSSVVLDKAYSGAAEPRWELATDELFERLSRSLVSRTPEQKKALQRDVESGFPGKGPRTAYDAAPGGTVTASHAAAPPAVRNVECARAPIPSAAGQPQCGVEKYVISGASGTPWNIPPVLASSGPAANAIMVEWNKFTDHFRVFTTPDDNWGFNGRNDFGGFAASADLQRIHGYSWGATVLGVMIPRSDFCVEITNEYFLGILINSYCSRYQPENDVFLNPAFTWTYNDLAAKLYLTSAWSVYSVLGHELGHGFGLGHSTALSLMTACDDRKGWQPLPDDAAGARARWPATARYSENLGVRLLVQGSDITCASSTQPSTSRTPVSYSSATSEVTIGSFMVSNTNNVAASDVSIDWYLTGAPGGSERYNLLGTTQLATVQPGVTSVAGPRLAAPPALSGTYYVTAVVRNAGTSSALMDASSASLNLVARASLQFEADSYTAGEASPSVTLRVTRTGGAAGAVSVSYDTTNGTAVAGVNFTAASGTLSWVAGDTSAKTITVSLRNDGVATSSRQFSVRLFSVSGGVLGSPSTATVTIVDDRPDVFPANCIVPTSGGWTNAPAGATTGWMVDTSNFTEGRCSLKSTSPGHAGAASATSVIELSADFVVGNVQFDRRVSSEGRFDCLVFSIDGVQQSIPGTGACSSGQSGTGVSGEQGWSAVSLPITAGRHTLRWTYSKDGSVSSGGDAAWIDNLQLPLLQTHLLTVEKAGTGLGSVSSAPAGISCGATCSAGFSNGTTVVLTATPQPGSVFVGWSGGCAGTLCSLAMTQARSVVASFAPATRTLSITKSGTGAGTVASSPAGINCGATCSASFNLNTVVTLTATPSTGSTFAGWSGACSGTGTCVATMDQARAVTAAFTIVPAPAAMPQDFNADGRSDILYRNFATGQLYRMLMNGFTVTGAGVAYTEPNTDWKVVADADFNGDRVSDLLWRNTTTGQVYVMPFSAAGMPAGGAIVHVEPDPAWKILFQPDVNGDGRADILWYNTSTGQVYVMLMNGASIIAQGFAYTEPDTQWQIVGVGDFAGSGVKNQLLWRHAGTGQVYQMTLGFNGSAFTQAGTMIFREPDTAWRIIGVADLTGDKRSDIVWRNVATGQVYGMPMNGSTVLPGANIHLEPNAQWQIVAFGDYDGDGKADLLWSDFASGQVYLMLMDGLTIASRGIVYEEPNAQWRVMGPHEYAR